MDFQVKQIGTVNIDGGEVSIRLEEEYIPAMCALDGFSHINVIWWFSDFDSIEARSIREVPRPYKKAPEKMGIFATRSPVRPNPLALSMAQVMEIDEKNGVIRLAYIDANDGSPVLDIKPYTPSIDRAEKPEVPEWCRHWPQNTETSGDFDWENEFTF